jgi:hypothetical protein
MGVPLLQDPSVWHVPLPLHSGDKTFPNVSLNVPFVLLTSVLLIVLYALRMLLAIIGAKDQIWSDSAAIRQAVNLERIPMHRILPVFCGFMNGSLGIKLDLK